MRAFDATDLYLLSVAGLLRLVELVGSARLRDDTACFVRNMAYRLSRHRREHSLASVTAYYGTQRTAFEVRHIVRGTFQTFWQDTFYLCRMGPGGVPVGTLQGAEHLRDATKRGHGVILLENSFFGFRNVARLLIWADGWRPRQAHSTEHLAGFQTHSETWLRSRVTRPLFDRREKQLVDSIIYMSSTRSLAFTRELAANLRENGLLYLSGEGQMGQRHVERVFLGQPRRFATGVFSLSKLTRAPILPIFCYSSSDGTFTCVIEPPLNVPDTRDAAEQGIAQFATRLEDYARRYPEQYRNWHASS